MYENHGKWLAIWAVATAAATAMAIGLLYAPTSATRALHLDLYLAPGYILYRWAYGVDFGGGSDVADYATVLGGTGLGWGMAAVLLAWLRSRVESTFAFLAATGLVVAVATFVAIAARMP